MKKNILKYWRNSLADAERPNHELERLQGIDISLKIIEEGIIPIDYMQDNLISLFNSAANELEEQINILIAPIVLKIKQEHGVDKQSTHHKELIPLWVPAYLSKDGRLLANSQIRPWISRTFLEPCNSTITIAKLSQVDEFFTLYKCDPKNWSDYWSFCLKFFQHVTNSPLKDFQHELFDNTNFAVIALNPRPKGTTSHIIKLYDNILTDNPRCKLLDNITSLINCNKAPLIDENLFVDHSIDHYGQMGPFALGVSQREALFHFFNLKKGEVLAVNGPPGTGKTTLLQSIVASMWVKAAYEKLEPPIIVATSTNNQAITNIINSFGTNDNSDILHTRWIDFVTSYGLYLNSDSKNKNKSKLESKYENENSCNWQTINPTQLRSGNNTSFGYCNDQEKLKDIEKNFLLQCSSWAKDILFTSTVDAMEYLHNKLVNTINETNSILTAFQDYQRIKVKFAELYPEAPEKTLAIIKDNLLIIESELEDNRKLKIKWNEYLFKNPEPWLPKLLQQIMPLPGIKRYVNKRLQIWGNIFFLEHIKKESTTEIFVKELYDKEKQLENDKLCLEESLKKLNCDIQEFESIEKEWCEWNKQLNIDSQEELFAKLDVNYRYKAFAIASHYWEARWLIQSQDSLSIKDSLGTKKLQMRWHRVAKLTPCLVATFHMLPSFFTAYDDGKNAAPLYNFIDLLIVDEAGQVSPEICGSSFSLAKTALIVGDTKQIEPVWNIKKDVDIYNLQKFKITNNFENALQLLENKIWASNGPLMEIGQKLSKYDKINEGGMYLNEHRRCVKEVISFCNELAYNNTLIIKRESIINYPLPHLGYAHINGHTEKSNSSSYNTVEAQVIANWIFSNRAHLCSIYPNSNLKDIIAIITPFTAQIPKIKRYLRENKLPDITVGTVHALQGAERPIIIFSSVYNSKVPSIGFLDNLNLLNVTVSRAKDSFLVFGDMSIFNPNRNTPIGILAKYLFAHEENEIKNIEIPISSKVNNRSNSVVLIKGAQQHDKQFEECTELCQNELHIVSPFLSINAITSDILLWLSNATKRGIKIFVYTDKDLNNRNMGNYNEGIKTLTEINVTVQVLNRIHNKSLWVDDKLLIEGSFNWLSARRDIGNQWCRYESSLVYFGGSVKHLIDSISKDLRLRKTKFS